MFIASTIFLLQTYPPRFLFSPRCTRHHIPGDGWVTVRGVSFRQQINACSTRVVTRRHFVIIYLYTYCIRIAACAWSIISDIRETGNWKSALTSGENWYEPRARLSGRNSFSRGHPLAFHTPAAAILVVAILTILLQIKHHTIIIIPRLSRASELCFRYIKINS